MSINLIEFVLNGSSAVIRGQKGLKLVGENARKYLRPDGTLGSLEDAAKSCINTTQRKVENKTKHVIDFIF